MLKSIVLFFTLLCLCLVSLPLKAFSSTETVSGIGQYDENNVFAKILRKEIPATIIFESEHVLAFEDIHPIKPVHVLVIPKGKYRSILDFSEKATTKEISELIRALGTIAKMMKIAEEGFSIMTNSGHNGGQTVPHLHFHLLGGEKVAWEQSLRSNNTQIKEEQK